MLADVLTMLEHARKPIHEISYAYAVGDDGQQCRQLTAPRRGQKLWGWTACASPPRGACSRPTTLVTMCRGVRRRHSGATATVTTDDIEAAVNGVDFIHTRRLGLDGGAGRVVGERVHLLLPTRSPPISWRRPGTADEVHAALPARLP